MIYRTLQVLIYIVLVLLLIPTLIASIPFLVALLMAIHPLNHLNKNIYQRVKEVDKEHSIHLH